MIEFEVLGTPAPKGSARAIMIGGKPRLVPSGSNANRDNMRSWDVNVRDAARAATAHYASMLFVATPLRVALTFRLARPGGHWGAKGLKPSAPPYPRGKPDADKLARATLDSLTGIVFDDDSRIVELYVAKTYATPGDEGAVIIVEAMPVVDDVSSAGANCANVGRHE